MNKQRILHSIASTLLFVPTLAMAQTLPQSLTLQGRLLNPSDVPVESASVDFQIRVFSPTNCLLYEESHHLNMSNSDGVLACLWERECAIPQGETLKI